MKTGIIGLGAMGFPIAMNLHQAEHLVCAWNRTHATAEALAARCGNLETPAVRQHWRRAAS